MTALANFNESAFLPIPTRAAEYQEIVDRGREIAKDKRVAIVGLARNIGQILNKTMARIERTGEMFRDYRVIIFENDSIDDTPMRLRNWARDNVRVHAISETLDDPINPGTRCLDRATRMANYRNKCQDYLLNTFPRFDYVMLVDTDLPGGWSYDGIANTMGQPEWDFMGSNGIIFKNWRNIHRKPLYYDVWAFRWYGDWAPCDSAKLNPKTWNRGDGIVPVFSCFGGLGIYTMDAYESDSCLLMSK